MRISVTMTTRSIFEFIGYKTISNGKRDVVTVTMTFVGPNP